MRVRMKLQRRILGSSHMTVSGNICYKTGPSKCVIPAQAWRCVFLLPRETVHSPCGKKGNRPSPQEEGQENAFTLQAPYRQVHLLK